MSNNIKFSIWKWVIRNFYLLKTSDIIHIHDVFFWIIPLLPLIRKPIFITFHGYEDSEPPSFKQIFWHKFAEKFTRGNICIGDFHSKWYKVRPTIVSYGGVGIALPEKTTRRKNRAIYIGRLHDDTGITEYLKAIKILKDIKLDVYGDGPLMKKSVAFVNEYNLPVTFKGFVNNASSKLANYDIAFVSRYLAILESLFVGTPVIAHYNNEIKFDYLSLSPFSKFISICSSAEEISNFSENIDTKNIKLGKEWAGKQTWGHVAKQYEQLWGLR